MPLVARYRIPSRTSSRVYDTWLADHTWHCTCPARKHCWHRRVAERLFWHTSLHGSATEPYAPSLEMALEILGPPTGGKAA